MIGQLDLPEVGGGRPLHLLHVPQHGGPRGDVLLLPRLRPRTPGPEVPLVETIHHRYKDNLKLTIETS